MPESALPTLPDLLREGLAIVFIGINPGLISARQGHYFARNTNRFWPAFSRSALSAPARRAMGRDRLGPADDAALIEHGFGFTDVVKRPTANAGQLAPGELAAAIPALLAKLARHRPAIACFHGLTGFRPFWRAALGAAGPPPLLGLQGAAIAGTRLFVVPNPSPANAHFTPADQAAWYDRLAETLALLQ